VKYDPGQLVRLKCEVPDVGLHVGQIGVVCTRWFEPLGFYELEFQSPANHFKVHVVLDQEQFGPMELQGERVTATIG
jgi:hypothetical protein